MEGGCYRKLKGIGEDLPSGGEGGKDLPSAGPSLPVFIRTEEKKKNRRPDEFLVCGMASSQETNPSNKREIVVGTR